MVAFPLLSGIVAGPAAEFIETVPLNLEPTSIDAKIAGKGQFKAPPGAVQKGVGPGVDRGGIVWNDRLYRVLGTKLCQIDADGTLTIIGDVGSGSRCRLDISFDRLIINSGALLYYFDGTALAQVTDSDLGSVVDAMWIDGYTMTTDGTYVGVTELDDPMQVKPLKYGSAESDPDPVTGLLRYREEAYIFGRNTVQTFRNIGGNGFPFATVPGGTIPYGCVNPKAKCLFGDGFAFVGSGRSEELNVFAGGQGSAVAFGSKAVCDALKSCRDGSCIELEARIYGGEQRLLVHLPGETWCYLTNVSHQAGQPVWFRMRSDGSNYRLRNMVVAYGEKWVGDNQDGRFGTLQEGLWNHWDIEPEWQFEAGMLYNDGKPFIVRSAELIGLPGRGSGKGSIFLSMTRDGETWSPERAITVDLGARTKRLMWRIGARFGNYMGFRFRGHGAALPGIAALNVDVAALGQ